MPDDTLQSDAVRGDPAGGIDRLLAIMARLRDPAKGCPWDVEQDFDSIAPYTIEEAYEVAEAIARRDMAELEASWATCSSRWSTTRAWPRRPAPSPGPTWWRAISDKMIRRHPHVFGDAAGTRPPTQQTLDWEGPRRASGAGAPERSPASPAACPGSRAR